MRRASELFRKAAEGQIGMMGRLEREEGGHIATSRLDDWRAC
jgi:hypothetical protein